MNIFLSWLGNIDLGKNGFQINKTTKQYESGSISKDFGPAAYMINYLKNLNKLQAIVISDFPKEITVSVVQAIKTKTKFDNIIIRYVDSTFSDPTDYPLIYNQLMPIIKEKGLSNDWHVNCSSGTSQITSTLMLLAKTHLKGKTYKSCFKNGKELMESFDFPFNVYLDLPSEEIIKRKQIIPQIDIKDFVWKSKKIEDVLLLARKAAQYDEHVLITGETGTGKEAIAKFIHNESIRQKHSMITVNCAAIPETLVESKLFGHKKGAFTDADRDTKGF